MASHAFARRRQTHSPPPPPPPPPLSASSGPAGSSRTAAGRPDGRVRSASHFGPLGPATGQLAAPAGPDDEYVRRLAAKIQSQAQELLDLQTDLDERKEYVSLCERFVVTFDPAQPLPLSADRLQAIRAHKAQHQDSAHVNKSSRHTLTTLTRQYDSACKKLHEQTERCAELERAVAEANRSRDVSERRVGSLQQKLGEAQSKLAVARRSLPDPAKEEKERAELEERVKKLEDERARLQRSLDNETQAGEEQRVYIDVLQAALKNRAEELGEDPEAWLDMEKAKFDVLASKAAVDRLQTRAAELEEALALEKERVRLEALQHKQTRIKLELYEPADAGNAIEEEKLGQSDLPGDLGKLSLEPSATPVNGNLKAHLVRIKKENDALLDYVRETLEPLKAEKNELEESLESTASALEASYAEEKRLRDELRALEEKSEALNLKVIERDVDVTAAHEARDVERHRAKRLEDELSQVRESLALAQDCAATKQRELDRLTEELDDLRARHSKAAAVEEQLGETQNALRCERRELVLVEDRRSKLEDQVRTLERELEATVAKLERSQETEKDATTECATLRKKHAELREALAGEQESNETLCAQLAEAREELAPLRAFRQRAAQVEKTIALEWTDEAAPERALDKLEATLKRLSSQRMAEVAVGEQDEQSAPGSVVSALEATLPHINALLFSAKSLVTRALTTEKGLRAEREAAEKRFETEKRLLHDEIHALRNKFEELEERRSESARLATETVDLRRNAQANEAAAGRAEADSRELARLRLRYANLEAKYLNLEQELDDQRNEYGRAQAPASVRVHDLGDMQVRLDAALAKADQVAALKAELDKATRLLNDQEAVAKQLEDQLGAHEDHLHRMQYDIDMTRRLCEATLKGAAVRYRFNHPAVQSFFAEQRSSGAGASDLAEQAATPVCELLEAILEHDARVGVGAGTASQEVERLAQTLDEVRRDHMQLLSSMQLQPPPVSRLSANGPRDLAAEETKGFKPSRRGGGNSWASPQVSRLNSSLQRAQRVVDKTRYRLERELEAEGRRRVVLGAETSSDSGYEDDHEEGLVIERHRREAPVLSRRTRGRAVSPAKVRVYRDGSIKVSTHHDAGSDEAGAMGSSTSASLRGTARRIERTEQVRRMVARPETPIAQRYREKLRVAQERFRRLSTYS